MRPYIEAKIYKDCEACEGSGYIKGRTSGGHRKTTGCPSCERTGKYVADLEFREMTDEEWIEKLQDTVDTLTERVEHLERRFENGR